MPRHSPLAFMLVLVILPAVAGAQNFERDRRIEEEKREHLRPTITTPRPPSQQPTQGDARPGPPVPLPIDAIYFSNLIRKRITYHYDVAKVIMILMGVDEDYIDLNSQVAYMRDQGWLPPRLQEAFEPTAPLRRGETAYLFLKALEIRGGIALHLFGPSERSALKELAFQGIMSPGLTGDLISGEELIQIMTQAAQRKTSQTPSQTP